VREERRERRREEREDREEREEKEEREEREKREKRGERKKREERREFCSTSPPRGNQVDGLPRGVSTEAVRASRPVGGVSDNRYKWSE